MTRKILLVHIGYLYVILMAKELLQPRLNELESNIGDRDIQKKLEN
jgi:hypothetical protein